MKTLARGADRQEVLKRLAKLKADQARWWGKMSCHQMVVHLSDSFLCPMGERKVSRACAPLPRGMYRWIALYVLVRWPHGIATRPEMEQGVGGTSPVEFSRDRDGLVAVIERFTNDEFEWAEHPIFGAMSEKDWMRWGYLHCDHHLRQFGV